MEQRGDSDELKGHKTHNKTSEIVFFFNTGIKMHVFHDSLQKKSERGDVHTYIPPHLRFTFVQ